MNNVWLYCLQKIESSWPFFYLVWFGLVRSVIVLVANDCIIKLYLVLENQNNHRDLAEGRVSPCWMLMMNKEWQAATSGSALAQFGLFTSMKSVPLKWKWKKTHEGGNHDCVYVFMLKANLGKGVRNRWGVSVVKVVPDQMVWCLPAWEKPSAPTFRPLVSACQIAGCITSDISCTTRKVKTTSAIVFI